MSSTSPQSSNLDAATIQVAEMLSTAAYDSLNGLSSDTNIQQLEAQGWNPVPTLPHQTDPNTSYQGIAFYKTINGVVQVVIANRGTVPTSVGDLTMDYDIAHNIQPPSDTSAQAYYQDVVSYFTGQGITNINVIETGHSLGGQEADFVATRGSLPAPTEAVTFDAPGIGPAAQTASSANAVNISNINDVIHLAGGTYVGNEATVSAPAPTLIDSAVGQALGAPLGGIGMLMGGMLGNVTANHAINDIASYLSADPALAAIDLSAYSAGQINQAVVNALAAMTPSQYYAMTSAQRAIFLAGVFSQYGSAGSSSGSISATGIQEAFTVVSSSPGAQTLTGSVGDSITLSSTGDALTSTASNGYTDTENFDATTGALTSDTWKNTIGTNGTDTYNTDGSSSSTVTYADGNYATTLDDGQGNITTDYYTKDGVEIRSTWVHSDGSSGTVDQYTDGQTLMPGGGTNPVPTTASGVMQNPDGSYTTVNWNAQNQSVTTNFAANGGQTSQSTGAGTGANDLTVASSSTAVVANLNGGYESVTTNHNAAGQDIGNTWYASYSDGTVDPNGDMITLATGAEATGTSWGWQGTTALSGSMTFDASGVQTLNIKALDGTSWVVTNEQQGSTVSHESSSGVLLSDQWAIADGPGVISGVPASASVTGTDSFNADGSGSGTFTDLRDGTSGTVTLNGQGDIVVVNTNASGTVTSEDTWNGSTDSYTVATLNGSGTTLNSYDYLANGNVIATDYAPDGTTIADQQTVAAGLVVNPDGSSFSKVVNADGSYTVYYMNASGDTTAYQYSASGQLTGTEHTSSYNWAIANASGTLSNGQSWTSPYNSATPTYTDSNGTTWTLYLNAASQTTGFDYVNKAAGTHGYGTYGSDGSLQEVEYAQNGTYEEIVQNSQGVVTDTTYFDASGNETGDAWTAPDGAHGGDTYNADGSSSGTSINADGSYGSYTDDGKGDMVSAEYSAAGVMLSEVWTNANGTSGNETFNAGGSTVTTSYNADGSYTVTTNDGKGDVFQTDYTAAGVKTGDAWQKANGTTGSDTFFAPGSAYNLLAEGQTTNPDGSSSQYQTIVNSNNLVETDTTFYASGGAVTGTSKNIINGNGTATVNSYSGSGTQTETMTEVLNSAGAVASDTWVKVDGSSGSDIFNTDGSAVSTTVNADKSSTVVSSDAAGNSTTDAYTSAGVLTSIAWSASNPDVSSTVATNPDGSTTTTQTNSANHSSVTTTVFSSGNSTKVLNDGHGDVTTEQFSSAQVLLSDTWAKSDGTSGGDTFNADGSSSRTSSDGNGNSVTDSYSASGTLTSDSWVSANGGSGTDTYNANHSSVSTTTNADGSYTQTSNDGAGNLTENLYSKTGVLESTDWYKSDGTFGYTNYAANGSVSSTFNSGVTSASGSSIADPFLAQEQGATITSLMSGTTVVGQVWQAANGDYGRDSINGESIVFHSDGSYSTYFNDSNPYTNPWEQHGVLTNYNASGAIVSTQWSNVTTPPNSSAAGSFGQTQFASDGSSSGWASIIGGDSVTYTADSTGNFWARGTDNGAPFVVENRTAGQFSAVDGGVAIEGNGNSVTGTNQNVDLGTLAQNNNLYQFGTTLDGIKYTYDNQSGQNGTNYGDTLGLPISSISPASVFQYNLASYYNTNTKAGFAISQYSGGINGVLIGFGTDGSGLTPYYGSVFLGVSGGATQFGFAGESIYSNSLTQLNEPAGYTAQATASGDSWTNVSGMHGSDTGVTGNIIGGSQLSAIASQNSGAAEYIIAGEKNQFFGVDGSSITVTADINNDALVTFENSSGAPTAELELSNTARVTQISGGAINQTEYYSDGSSTAYTSDGSGNIKIQQLNAAGSLTSDYWATANGAYGSDYFNSNGEVQNYSYQADGSSSQRVDFGNGYVQTTYLNAAGAAVFEEWSNATNGSSGQTVFNADGSSDSSTTSASGLTTVDTLNSAGVLIGETISDSGGISPVKVTHADGSSSITTKATGGTSVENFSASGALINATTTNADGSTVSTTYNADGSSTSTKVNADGSYSVTSITASGQSVSNYSASGFLFSSTVTSSNSTSESTTYTMYNPDGSRSSETSTVGSPQGYSNTQTNADGSYSVTATTSIGTTVDNYNTAGNLVSLTTTNIDGTSQSLTYNTDGSISGKTVNADGSYTTNTDDGKGDFYTDDYTASGVLISDSWMLSNGNYGSDKYSGGVLIGNTWYNASSNTSGSDAYDATGTLVESTWTNSDGSTGSTTYHPDGSYTTSSQDTQGDVYTDNYSVSGVLTSDAWKLANGNSGTDAYVNGVISSDTWKDASGVTGTDSYNASGALIYSKWTNTDGSWGSDTYDGNSTVTMTTATDASGSETIQTPTGTNTIDLSNNPIVLTNTGATDTIDLGTAVAPDQLWFAQSGTDLVVSVLGSTENLTVKDWFNGLANQVSEFVAGNGQVLAGSNVEQLVQAMAAFSPPTSSQTAYTTAEATNLDPVIAANWH